jgi:hypothetical protein
MTPQEAWTQIKEAKYFYTFLVLVVTVAVVLLLIGNVLLHKVAEALIIAAFLAGTVDIYLKSRFAREVAKDVSPFLMAYAIPGELREEVAEICRIEYYRFDFVIRHELVELQDTEHLLMKTTVTYCVNNLLDHYVPYTQSVWVERNADKHLEQQIGKVGAERVYDLQRNPLSYSEDGQGSAVEKSGGLYWEKKVLLPPKGGLAPNFWYSYYQVFSSERYEPFITSVAAVGARVRVKYPEWLDVQVIFQHRLGNDFSHRKEDATTSVWEFRHALLPFSVIATIWRPKADR